MAATDGKCKEARTVTTSLCSFLMRRVMSSSAHNISFAVLVAWRTVGATPSPLTTPSMRSSSAACFIAGSTLPAVPATHPNGRQAMLAVIRRAQFPTLALNRDDPISDLLPNSEWLPLIPARCSGTLVGRCVMEHAGAAQHSPDSSHLKARLQLHPVLLHGKVFVGTVRTSVMVRGIKLRLLRQACGHLASVPVAAQVPLPHHFAPISA